MLGRKWTECIDKEPLREVEQKEKEVGNVLQNYVLSLAEVLNEQVSWKGGRVS